MWKINLAPSSEQPLRILFCPPDLWTSAVSLCDPSSSERWTGGSYWWAWRALSTPYSPAADQRERERGRAREGREEWRGRQKRSENGKETREVTELERAKPESPVSECERALCRCHSLNRRLRPLLTPTGVAKRLVSVQYNGQLWMLSVTAGDH